MFLIATALIRRCLNPVDTLRLSLDTPPIPIDIVFVSNSKFIAANCLNKKHKKLYPVWNFSNKIESFWFNFYAVCRRFVIGKRRSSICCLQAFGGMKIEMCCCSVYNIINIVWEHHDKENLISDKSQEFNYEHSTVMRCHKNNDTMARTFDVALMDINSWTKGNESSLFMCKLWKSFVD